MVSERNLDFDWREEGSFNGVSLPPDSLQRAQYAEFLTGYLCSRSEDKSYVLNLNSSWGSGKTYFIKRWASTLESKFDVIYVDAWKHDYSDDPLLTVVSEVRKKIPSLKDTNKLRVVGAVVKKGLPSLMSELINKVSGIDFSKPAYKIEEQLIAESAARATGVLLDSFEQQSRAIESFREYLTELKPTKGKQKPVFVFIDELDRCRPTFAIELLETVKHLFDVPQFVFVIATDTEQLSHSICAIYGQGFDARTYLSRFFDDTYKLPASDTAPFIESTGLNADLERIKGSSSPMYETESLVALIQELFRLFEVSLRDIEKIVSRFKLLIAQLEIKQKTFDPAFTMLALILDKKRPTWAAELLDLNSIDELWQQLSFLKTKNVTIEFPGGGGREYKLTSLLNDRMAALRGELTEETLSVEFDRYFENNSSALPANSDINRKKAVIYEPNGKAHLDRNGYISLLENAALLD